MKFSSQNLSIRPYQYPVKNNEDLSILRTVRGSLVKSHQRKVSKNNERRKLENIRLMIIILKVILTGILSAIIRLSENKQIYNYA